MLVCRVLAVLPARGGRLTNTLPLGYPALFGSQHADHAVKVGCCAFCDSILASLHLEHCKRHRIHMVPNTKGRQSLLIIMIHDEDLGQTYLENRFAVGTALQVKVSG